MTDARPEPSRMTISDPQMLRALAHPARLSIMEHLASTGAAVTATECAGVVGLSPSATSYHLRALARYGLIEEAPGRGDARERVWRSMAQSWSVMADQNADPETRAAEEAFIEAFAARGLDRVREWTRRSRDEPREWYDAAMIHRTLLLLTADELTELNAAVVRLLEPYRRAQRTAAPEGARLVAVQYSSIPAE